jgi:hypothetical protein
MATSFKTFHSTTDSVVTRNLLHEAIPLTGTIVSGTYADNNIKNYSHGMFQSVYDYPVLSSSANHIFDLTCGYAATSGLSGTSTTHTQNAKKINIYNQMAQVLAGFDASGAVRLFDEDGDLSTGPKINEAYFINLTRLLSKDEIKKGSFSLSLGVSSSYALPWGDILTITDKSGSNGYKVNSPAGEYGILFATGSESFVDETKVDQLGYAKVGLVYYQAGIVVLSASAFGSLLQFPVSMSRTDNPLILEPSASVTAVLTGSAISGNCDDIRHRFQNISFNNTTELNSTVYFCRVNNTDFNYSSNPTYLNQSKIVVKEISQDVPVSYVTAVGLYSGDNELLAVAKLSEPLKKDPTTEFTIRVRLDY